jgi:predicted AAA+ superfamily ATPase
MESLFEVSNSLLNRVNTDFQRSMLTRIDWSMPLIEIRGSRGVGKTTLMLQRAKQLQKSGEKVIYVTLDSPQFYNLSLYEFADSYSKMGGTYLFVDEVHRYPAKHKDSDWSLEIKNIYDAFPDLKIVYSGSSILHLFKGKGDLSRRKASYTLHGLSFREYLHLYAKVNLEIISLEDILSNHSNIAAQIVQEIKPLPHFKKYLKVGYYPFFKGNEAVFFKQLQEIVNTIIDTDIPYLVSVSHNAREQLKRLLGAISSTVPYVPNLGKLADNVFISDQRTLLKYLLLLDEAQIISLVRSDSKGNKLLQKPEKILMGDSNLIYALGLNNDDIGTIRESFFYDQLSVVGEITYSSVADFMVDNKYLFEVGGKNKGNKQIKNQANAYLAADDIEIGFANKIPIWLFGLMY